jgi:hypothetical protein
MLFDHNHVRAASRSVPEAVTPNRLRSDSVMASASFKLIPMALQTAEPLRQLATILRNRISVPVKIVMFVQASYGRFIDLQFVSTSICANRWHTVCTGITRDRGA